MWLNFVSGDVFEDQIASLTWPCTVPPVGRWSGIRLRPTMKMPSDVMYGLHHDILYRRLELAFISAVIIKLRLGNVIYL